MRSQVSLPNAPLVGKENLEVVPHGVVRAVYKTCAQLSCAAIEGAHGVMLTSTMRAFGSQPRCACRGCALRARNLFDAGDPAITCSTESKRTR